MFIPHYVLVFINTADIPRTFAFTVTGKQLSKYVFLREGMKGTEAKHFQHTRKYGELFYWEFKKINKVRK